MDRPLGFRRASRPSLEYKAQYISLCDIKKPLLSDNFCPRCRELLQPIIGFYENQVYQAKTVTRSQSQQCTRTHSNVEDAQNAQIRKMQAEIKQLRLPIETHRNVVSSYRKKISELEHELAQAGALTKLKLLEQEEQMNLILSRAFSDKEIIESENLRLKQNLDYLGVRNSVLQNENDERKVEQAKQSEQQHKLMEQIQFFEQENEELRESVEQHKTKVEQQEKKAANTLVENAERILLSERLAALSSDNEALQNRIIGIEATNDELASTLHREEIANEYLRHHIEHLESKNADLQLKIDAGSQIGNCGRFTRNHLPSAQLDAEFAYAFAQDEDSDEEAALFDILTMEETQFVETHGELLKYQPDISVFADLSKEQVEYGFEKLQNDCFSSALLKKSGVPAKVAFKAEIGDFECRRASGNYMFFKALFEGFECNYFTVPQCRMAAQIIYAGFQAAAKYGDVFLQREDEVVFF